MVVAKMKYFSQNVKLLQGIRLGAVKSASSAKNSLGALLAENSHRNLPHHCAVIQHIHSYSVLWLAFGHGRYDLSKAALGQKQIVIPLLPVVVIRFNLNFMLNKGVYRCRIAISTFNGVDILPLKQCRCRDDSHTDSVLSDNGNSVSYGDLGTAFIIELFAHYRKENYNSAEKNCKNKNYLFQHSLHSSILFLISSSFAPYLS